LNVVEGTVEAFDERRGDGWLVTDGGERFYFHCVVIASGSRSIPVGVRVSAKRSVGRLGRDEVDDVRQLVAQ
jgi:cold shock CspA family protein